MSGYRYVYRNGEAVYEHRAVMEEILGRPLLPTEQVHHIDGNRANNDPSNLIILNAADHTHITASRSHSMWRSLAIMAVRELLARGWSFYQISSEFHISIETLMRTLDRYHDVLHDPPQ